MRLPNPYRKESDVVAHRLAVLRGQLDWRSATTLATPWVQAVRDNPPPFWVMERLMHEYPISSNEGLALMRLAEALLRVPDAATAVALTADQLGRADFDGASDQALARLSSAAIALSKHFLPDPNAKDGQGESLLVRLGQKSVVAATLRAVALLGRQFVLGQTIESAIDEADQTRQRQPNLQFSYDMLGEGARTDADALAYGLHYQKALVAIVGRQRQSSRPEAQDGISIKLSALHPRYEDAQRERVMEELVPRVWSLCELAARHHINLTIDAEEVDRLELSLEVFEALLQKVARHYPDWQGFGMAIQAYQTRALEWVEHVIALARRYRVRLMCRLVKGAYWDSEIKRAQELGLAHYPVFTHKHHTDISYLACASTLLNAPDAVYPQFATHNAGTIAALLQMGSRCGSPFELQRLHGMGEGIYREVLKNPTVSCRVYAPVGAHRDLLAYLVRRLLENGANSSFVHQLANPEVAPDVLLASPLILEPQSALPLPPDLYNAPTHGGAAWARANSTGLDISCELMRQPLQAAYAQTALLPIANTTVDQAHQACQRAMDAFTQWEATPVAMRVNALNDAANALSDQLPQFSALLVKEAHKTWNDAVGEVREAIDFLRFYAAQATVILQDQTLDGPTGESNILRLRGRGCWVCISPWNFPLAIFVGQVAAALVTGNTVVAKPAEQTPLVAQRMVDLLHQCGVPTNALQLAVGEGETVGAALIAYPGIAGVVFTGSTQVAKHINRALAAKDGPIVPLIAETGGINAMVVDSSALPEQVCDAVVQSAFRSAGQRCSALRLLCVHASIADKVIAMIAGASAELTLGDPSDWATDLGPVIDSEAYAGIQAHVARMQKSSKPLWAPKATESGAAQAAHLVAPQAFEIQDLSEMREEIFGPVLHVLRWQGDPLQLIAQINAMGYGLTLGVHTRIDSRATAIAQAASVGNVYVNRNQIGAVVGVQPFGGQGLSGTGPKAGGPHYLHRFCTEQTVTINTTAAGGNVALVAG